MEKSHNENVERENSFCEYFIEKTPQYAVTQMDENLLSLTIDLPHVEKKEIQLIYDTEKKTLSLSTPFEVYQGFHNNNDKTESTHSVPSAQEKEQETPKEEKSGLVVIDEDEEEEKKSQEIKQGDSQSVSVRKESSAIRCKVSGNFKATYSLPKATDMSKITAKFDNEKLSVSLPIVKELSSTRTVQIEWERKEREEERERERGKVLKRRGKEKNKIFFVI